MNNLYQKTYDIIVVGGGIYGVMVASEATRIGKKVLVLEKDQVGCHTSANSLRIIHGGLRYLQSLDIKRFNESVSERKWFLKNYANHVKPISCLMPLYNVGMHRPPILKIALGVNDILSYSRNIGLDGGQSIPRGKIVTRDDVIKLFPGVDKSGLTAGAMWTDAYMVDSNELIQTLVNEAKERGACFLEQTELQDVCVDNNIATGVKVFSKKEKKTYNIKGMIMINTAGPWCREIVKKIGNDDPDLFHPSLAWNIRFKKTAVAKTAVAVTPKKKNGRTYFILPNDNKIFAGTGHAAWDYSKGIDSAAPNDQQVKEFIDDLNLAIPGLNLSENDIDEIFSGLLPAKKINSTDLKCREIIQYHGPEINNLYSVSGVKFTTARKVALKLLNKIKNNNIL